MSNLDQKGFTLLEVLMVVAIMAIMLVAAGYYMGNQGSNAQLKSAARDLISNIQLARTRAIRDTRPWAIEFNTPDLNSYTIYSDWDGDDESIFRSVTLPTNVSFGSNLTSIDTTPVAIVDGITYPDNRVIFNPNGTSSANGAVYFSDFTKPDMAFDSIAVSSSRATGRVKSQRGRADGWSN